MENKKTLKMALMPLVVIFALSVVYLGLPSDSVVAQSAQYPVSTLTAANNSKITIQTQAIEFKNGKWTYNFTWKRTRDTSGMIKIVPVVNESFVEAKLDPAPRESASPWSVQLDPETRYVLRYYAAPSVDCDQNNLATDPECWAIESVYFNTRNASGQIMATSDVALSRGGTKVDTGGNSGSGSTNTNVSLSSLQAQINSLLALVQSLIAQLSAKGVTYVATSSIGSTVSSQTTQQIGTSGLTSLTGPVFMSVGANDNTEGGIRQAAEPLVVSVNPYYQPNMGMPPSAPDREENGIITREIWVYATEGRKFNTWVGYTGSCTDSTLQIQRNWNLPSGISFKPGCSATHTAVTDGRLEGVPSAAGEYNSTITTTKTTATGTVKAVTKIRFFVYKSNRSWPVSVQPIGTDGLPTYGSLPQGNRALITWTQDTQTVGSFFSSQVDIWIAPAENAGKHPDFITNKQLIGTGGEYEGLNTDCNNSTRGGGDPYKTGCGSYNWLVGKTLGTNMAPGDYVIYVTPHPVTKDDLGYGGCGLIESSVPSTYTFTATQSQLSLGKNSVTSLRPQTDCYGYSYGMTRITIAQPTGSGLPNLSPGIILASFSDIEGGLSYIKKNSSGQITRSGSVGIGTGSNTDQSGCSMNETAGVSCGITINAIPGDTLQIDWKSMFKGQPAGQSHTSTIFISGPYDKGNPTELASIRDCTQNIVAGGLGPNPSQGFMNSHQGSKSFTINPCMSGKVIYLTYTVWMYGCGNLTGGENFTANQTNPNLVLSSGQTSCRLAVKGEGTIVVNVDRNSNIGEIVSGVPSSVPTAPYIENTSCTTGNSDDSAFVAGKKYIASWIYPNITFNPLTDKIVFRAAKGSSYSYQNGIWVKTNPAQDDVAKQAVSVGCPAGTTCHVKNNDVLANPNDIYRQETYYWVTDTEPHTTYWNRVAFVKNFGLANQSIMTEKTWPCNTMSGDLPR